MCGGGLQLLLFDEFEKAHREVSNLLLRIVGGCVCQMCGSGVACECLPFGLWAEAIEQVLDEGHLTDSAGRYAP